MRIESRPEAINREALLFGLMVGIIATTAMTVLGGIAFLTAALGGAVLALVVWFVVVRLGRDLPPPRGPGNLDTAAKEPTPVTPAAPRSMPSPVVAPGTQPGPLGAPSGADAASAGARPEALSGARDGNADDLKQIKGVGPKLEELLHTHGIYHIDQIAGWGPDEIAWMDDNLEGFKGRVSRDDWVGQARSLTVA